ncbi:MAG: hypothetical protein ABJA78_16740 [Ferruginibacter sp.]
MYRINFLLVILVLSLETTNAQNKIENKKVIAPTNVAAPISKVLKVQIVNDSLAQVPGSVACHHYIKANIISIGNGTVKYNWILIDKNAAKGSEVIKEQTGSFTPAGTGSDDVVIVLECLRQPKDYSLTLTVTSPNSITSKEFIYH